MRLGSTALPGVQIPEPPPVSSGYPWWVSTAEAATVAVQVCYRLPGLPCGQDGDDLLLANAEYPEPPEHPADQSTY